MKVAVISDIHDHRENLVKLLERLSLDSLDFLLLLGDYGAPGAVMKKLLKLGLPTHAIWGNNDGEVYNTMNMFFEHRNHATISHRHYDWLELDGKKIFITHYDDLARPMAMTRLYDVVFFGHNHTSSQEIVGDCLLANPGAVLGNLTPASFGLWDTQSNNFDIVVL